MEVLQADTGIQPLKSMENGALESITKVILEISLFVIDETGKTPGRGAYLCKNKACLEKAKKTRKVERSFVQMFPPETYKEMEDALTRKVQELTDDLPESR